MAASILQVVSGEGELDKDHVQGWVAENGIDSCGVNFTVVAIMGPQSSGKSTLLNNLFGTGFEEMDALSGRRQTTHGIWLARSPKVAAPATLVMDLEGSDGRERGEDDTSFERQSALFALAVADIVLVNMWAKDVGRETGAGKPLLKTIFQVNLKLFQPAPNRQRKVLLFVFRDRTKTPLATLRRDWEADLKRMWESITKPPQYETSSFNEFFDVQYADLPNYEERTEDFQAEAVLLRRRFTAEDPETYLRESEEKLPGHALALNMAQAWESIREHKDLNLPAHRVMVANIRCAEIGEAQLAAFRGDAAWQGLAGEAGQDVVPAFGQQASDLMDSAMAGYEEEARYFERSVSAAKEEELLAALHALVRPAFDAQMGVVRDLAMAMFQGALAAATAGGAAPFSGTARALVGEALVQFDGQATDVEVPGTDWGMGPARAAFERDLAAHVAAARGKHIRAAVEAAKRGVCEEVSAAALSLLEAPPPDLWPRLTASLKRALQAASEALGGALEGYDVSAEEQGRLEDEVEGAAREQVMCHAREAANTALSRVKDRFGETFNRDPAGMPRAWTPSADIPAFAGAARQAAGQLLAHLAVARIGDGGGGGRVDVVERAVMQQLVEDTGAAGAPSSGRGPGAFDLLSAREWPASVAPADVLLPPAAVRSTWRQFLSDSMLTVQQAVATQEANRAAQSRMPPIWALAAMVVLGFNEAVAVLRNPLWLLIILVLFLFGRTVYQEMDVEREMQRGLLPAAMTLSAKFVPTLKRVAGRTVESAKHFLQDHPPAADPTNAAPANIAASSATTENSTATAEQAGRALGGGAGRVRQRARAPEQEFSFGSVMPTGEASSKDD